MVGQGGEESVWGCGDGELHPCVIVAPRTLALRGGSRVDPAASGGVSIAGQELGSPRRRPCCHRLHAPWRAPWVHPEASWYAASPPHDQGHPLPRAVWCAARPQICINNGFSKL